MQHATDTVKIESLEDYLRGLIAHAMQEGNQVAVWRKPKSNYLQVLLDKSGKTKRVNLNLEELPTGFIVHPFEDQKDQKAFFLEADTYFKIDLNLPFKEQAEQIDLNIPLRTSEENARVIRQHFAIPIESEYSGELKACSKKDFISLVNTGIEAIKSGKLNKIVPARLKKKPLSENFELIRSLTGLIGSYPNAFINFFHIPDIGSWLGASPEILIQTKGNEFYTMSLAGTQKAKGDNPLKNAAWTQKEIEEQALVSRYIVDCFKKIRLREYDEQGPKTVIAGNLLHLRSDFRVDMKATNFPQLGSVMLKLLHPTSAVCGMPRNKAFEFLRQYEKLDRSLFAGFIGPVNVEEETSIYVNLRTARLTDKEAFLYAGAGVTEDSIPEKEWEETELKCEIIGKHLN
ncbi:chorismate-binding protein [Cecembia calidifontis]|uniref:Isochorismate synthase n=1 Tax=Cecembia calidifontis TaxID=1187080 RepID=A0A4Q7P8C0_9BACT|nr:chorismate-binding protein [Cecembia calidifontis]RZS96335.1 isochorismate synthase [Cecembia calidifontis]